MNKPQAKNYSFATALAGRQALQPFLGFTLVEMIVAVAVFAVLALGVISLVSNVFSVNLQQGGLLSDADQARKLAFQITQETRSAVTSATGAYALDTAGAQNLVFYSQSDNAPDIEKIRYFFQNNKLYKGVIKPTGTPPVYNAGSEVVRVVQNNLANGVNPIFYYYDGSYNGVVDNFLQQPVSVTAVKYVKVNIQVFNKAGVKNTNIYAVTAGGTVRSLKVNLAGNPPPPPQPPTVNIQGNGSDGPVTIAYNTNATLSWTSANATTCTASGAWSGSKGVSGNQSTGNLTSTQTYSLSCTGAGGTTQDSVTVQVSPPPAPTVDILANGAQGPITVNYNSVVTLTWSSTTATTCSASGGWSGTKSTSGSFNTAALTTSQTFTLSCTGPGGSGQDSVTVNVNPAPPVQPSCVSTAPEANKTARNDNGPFNLFAYGVQDATSVNFQVTLAAGGGSTVNVTGASQGGGTWKGTITLSTIPTKGIYNVSTFMSNASYTNVLCGTTSFNRR